MKQVQFENQLAINSNITLKDIRNLILATRLIIQDNAINDLKTTLPRLGTFKKKLRAAKQKYNINTETVQTISAKNSLYMTRAGFQQQLLEPRYHESYTYKPDRIYPDSELCHLLSTLTNLELKTCKEFVYQFVSTVINTVIEGENVTIRNLGAFSKKTISMRPIAPRTPPFGTFKIFFSSYYAQFITYHSVNENYYLAKSLSCISWLYEFAELEKNIHTLCCSSTSGVYSAIVTVVGGRQVQSSYDGLIWTNIGTPDGVNNNNMIMIQPSGAFVKHLTYTSLNPLIASSDGFSWSEITQETPTQIFRIFCKHNFPFALAFGKKLVDTEFVSGVFITYDGFGYSFTTNDVSISLGDCAYSPVLNTFVIIDGTNLNTPIAISNGGTSWSLLDTGIDFYDRQIEYAQFLELFVITGIFEGETAVLTSTDSINWTPYKFGFYVEPLCVACVETSKQIIIYLNYGTGYTSVVSTDGIKWKARTTYDTREVINFRAAKALKIAIQ